MVAREVKPFLRNEYALKVPHLPDPVLENDHAFAVRERVQEYNEAAEKMGLDDRAKVVYRVVSDWMDEED